MIKYLFDSSVILEFYQPRAVYRDEASYLHSTELRAHISAQKFKNKAILFIPSFCVTEVRNKLASWYHRGKNVFKNKGHYMNVFGRFVNHVRRRNFFYSYDLNRYHNLNTDEIVDIEHTTETEFQVTNLPRGTDPERVNEKLKEKNRYDHIGRYYLSGLDILVIAMGMELKKIHGTEIHLLTNDKRMVLISRQKPAILPKPYYWSEIKVSDLPTS